MRNPSRPVRLTAVGVCIAYAVALRLTHVQLDGHARQGLAYLPSAAGLITIAFDLWLWKLPVLHRFVKRPRVDGTWYCILTPNRQSHIPDGGNWGPIEAAVLIEQTYWTIAVTTMTAESRSISTSAQLRNNGSGNQNTLAYTYSNEPGQGSRPRSQPHVGASELNVVGRVPSEITGSYWTARFTAGDMALVLVNRKTDYPTCSSALNAVPAGVRVQSR